MDTWCTSQLPLPIRSNVQDSVILIREVPLGDGFDCDEVTSDPCYLFRMHCHNIIVTRERLVLKGRGHYRLPTTDARAAFSTSVTFPIHI